MSDPLPSSGHAPADPALPGASAVVPVDIAGTTAPTERFRTIEDELEPPIQRRVILPIVLFITTCFTTYAAGTYHWYPTVLGSEAPDRERREVLNAVELLSENWRDGLTYMAAVMGVLLAHEMGHFVMTIRHRIHASYPMFIPVPLTVMGTMGAVIGMQGSRADRKQLFDIGLAGPLAGLVLTVPLVWFGIQTAEIQPQVRDYHFGRPLMAQLFIQWLRPELLAGQELRLNAFYMAGWVGMLITGLNMIPMSQLDGGHVAYALWRHSAWTLARALLMLAVVSMVITDTYTWVLMIVLVSLIGVDHPPTADDHVPLGRVRWVIGVLSMVIPILCFTPTPLYLK